MFDIVIIGGGPAGIFAAFQAKNKNNNAKIIVLEKTNTLLSKVKISGGGRCNITNAVFDPKELSSNYPRGKNELLGAFHQFGPQDMIEWLKSLGISIKIEKDKKVFPSTNSSQTIIDGFLREIKNKNIEIRYNQNIDEICKREDFFEVFLEDKKNIKSKNIILATGSSQRGLEYAKMLGHNVEPFISSLFPFKIANSNITQLKGISKEDVRVSIKNTPFSFNGSILITHEGFSGPAIINLSSLAAKYLNENNYKAILSINWLSKHSKEDLEQKLFNLQKHFPQRNLVNLNPFDFPNSLWTFLLQNCVKTFLPIQNVPKKNLILLIEKLTKDEYPIVSKSQNKSEFVSCGGVDLKEISFKDMQSKKCKNLYIVGELLNIDGITGGFNLQNAWTTGYIAGNSLSF